MEKVAAQALFSWEKQKLGGRFDQREGWGMGWAQAQVQSRGSGVVGGGGSH